LFASETKRQAEDLIPKGDSTVAIDEEQARLDTGRFSANATNQPFEIPDLNNMWFTCH
jgi:hypothetical protein